MEILGYKMIKLFNYNSLNHGKSGNKKDCIFHFE